MEMRAREDIEMGEDISPSLPPLSSSLYDSFLLSHCSSCFSPLSQTPFSRNYQNAPLLYCSPLCSSSVHSLSAEIHLPASSSDLRAALRFLFLLESRPRHLNRLGGLLTNHRNFIMNCNDDDEIVAAIRDGARAMAVARSERDCVEWSGEVALEEAVLCLVVTNSVEVHDDGSGRALGIAVYDDRFSWINHSCSPNACYRFVLSGPNKNNASSPSSTSGQKEASLNMLPSGNNDIENPDCGSIQLRGGHDGYGPRVIVRSIKRIQKGEEVTVAYTDLLVPKAMRQAELWMKHRFICCCRRCSASPLTYVDHALQEICSYCVESSNLSSEDNVYRDEALKLFSDHIDDTINEYLSDGDPESCRKKLESILTLGISAGQLGGKHRNSQMKFRLFPLHHLSLSAYTALASAYKMCSSNFSILNSETDKHMLEGFHMSRMSSAYSLLLGGATHHLFQSEYSLIASVANFWANAGESLLDLARSSAWSLLAKPDLHVANLSSLAAHKCAKCSLMGRFEENLFCNEARNEDLEVISKEFSNCASNFTNPAWSFLTQNCCYLKEIKDPIDFSWLQLGGTNVGSFSGTEEECISAYIKRSSVYELAVHCLLYGGLLANVYYGRHSHLVHHIQDIIMNLSIPT